MTDMVQIDSLFDEVNSMFMGHLLITDASTGEVLINKRNAIHYEQMSITLIKALAQKQGGHLYTMAFGNGAATASATGVITYLPPNSTGLGAELYNQTYTKTVYEDNLEIRHTPGELYTDLVIRVTLGFGEPAGQRAFDDAISLEDKYTFNEIGLKNFDGELITHVIFSPVQKALSRIIDVCYTLRCSMV